MTENDLLRIAKKSIKNIDIPKRPIFKEFREWMDERWWNIKMKFLWWMVKIHLFSFYKWESMCSNRKLLFE